MGYVTVDSPICERTAEGDGSLKTLEKDLTFV